MRQCGQNLGFIGANTASCLNMRKPARYRSERIHRWAVDSCPAKSGKYFRPASTIHRKCPTLRRVSRCVSNLISVHVVTNNRVVERAQRWVLPNKPRNLADRGFTHQLEPELPDPSVDLAEIGVRACSTNAPVIPGWLFT